MMEVLGLIPEASNYWFQRSIFSIRVIIEDFRISVNISISHKKFNILKMNCDTLLIIQLGNEHNSIIVMIYIII